MTQPVKCIGKITINEKQGYMGPDIDGKVYVVKESAYQDENIEQLLTDAYFEEKKKLNEGNKKIKTQIFELEQEMAYRQKCFNLIEKAIYQEKEGKLDKVERDDLMEYVYGTSQKIRSDQND